MAQMNWAERFINWQFEILADLFGDWPAIAILILLPAFAWGAIAWYLWGPLIGASTGIVVAVFVGVILLIVGTRGIQG